MATSASTANDEIDLFDSQGNVNLGVRENASPSNNFEGIVDALLEPGKKKKPLTREERLRAIAYDDYVRSGETSPFHYDPYKPYAPLVEQKSVAPEQPTAPISPGKFTQMVMDPATPPQVLTSAKQSAYQNPTVMKAMEGDQLKFMEDLNSTIKFVRDSFGKAVELQDEDSRLSMTKAEVVNAGLRAKHQQNVAHAADKGNYLSRAGINTSDVNSEVNRAAAETATARQEFLGIRNYVSELESISFLDDPASWLLAQFELPGAVKQYNKVAGVINDNKRYIDAQAQTAQQVASANAGKTAAMAEAELESLTAQNLIKAQIDANKAKEALLIKQGASEEQILRLRASAVQMGLTAENQAASREDRALRHADVEARAEERLRLARDEAARKKAALDSQAEMDQFYKERVGRYMPSVQNEKDWKQLPKKTQERFAHLLNAGDGSLGDNFGDVLELIKITGVKSVVPPGDKDQLKVLQVAKQLFDAEFNKFKDVTKPEEAAKKASEFVVKGFQGMQAVGGEGSGDKFNPYAPLPMRAAMKILPASNLVVQAASELNGVVAPTEPIPHSMVITKLLADVKAKKVNLSDVTKDIQEYAGKVIAANNTTFNFSQYALPAQTELRIKLPVGWAGMEKSVNIANPAEFQRVVATLRLGVEEKKRVEDTYQVGSMPTGVR